MEINKRRKSSISLHEIGAIMGSFRVEKLLISIDTGNMPWNFKKIKTMDSINDMISKLTEFIKSETKIETITGTQFQLGEFTCVPVMALGLGLGFGGGEGTGTGRNNEKGEGTGMGGGAGMGMGPVGFLVTKGDEIQFISTRSSKGLSAAFEKLPDLLEKYMNKSKKETAEAD